MVDVLQQVLLRPRLPVGRLQFIDQLPISVDLLTEFLVFGEARILVEGGGSLALVGAVGAGIFIIIVISVFILTADGAIPGVARVGIIGNECFAVDAVIFARAHRLSQKIRQLILALVLQFQCVALLQAGEKFIIHGLTQGGCLLVDFPNILELGGGGGEVMRIVVGLVVGLGGCIIRGIFDWAFLEVYLGPLWEFGVFGRIAQSILHSINFNNIFK
jgi:hypothetical protein